MRWKFWITDDDFSPLEILTWFTIANHQQHHHHYPRQLRLLVKISRTISTRLSCSQPPTLYECTAYIPRICAEWVMGSRHTNRQCKMQRQGHINQRNGMENQAQIIIIIIHFQFNPSTRSGRDERWGWRVGGRGSWLQIDYSLNDGVGWWWWLTGCRSTHPMRNCRNVIKLYQGQNHVEKQWLSLIHF